MIFIDTGAFLARYLRRDQHHHGAVTLWEQLVSSRENCVTSNFVLDETFTLLGRWAGYGFAVQRAKNILPPRHSPYADRHVSFTDGISFVLMKRERIDLLFSFDRHFELAGFHMIPD
jgi:predicted nucleic acid-binding protein